MKHINKFTYSNTINTLSLNIRFYTNITRYIYNFFLNNNLINTSNLFLYIKSQMTIK